MMPLAKTVDVLVPDVGDFNDIPVIEILVQVGDAVSEDDALLTLESDKATMDVPSPVAGKVTQLHVQVGDAVSQGSLLASIEASDEPDLPDQKNGGENHAGERPAAPRGPNAPGPEAGPGPPIEPMEEGPLPLDSDIPSGPAPVPGDPGVPDPRAPSNYRRSPTEAMPSLPGRRRGLFHATPSVRRFARELGVELGAVDGTGRKGRIVREDISGYVKAAMTSDTSSGSARADGPAAIPTIPAVDFTRFGETELQPLSRIKRLTGVNLHRAWLNVPLVTHRDEADVTELEPFRQSLRAEGEVRNLRITVLAFILKALVAGMREFPSFNASLSPDGESLILKKYFHIGMAVDTPNGLVVPVIRDVDGLRIFELAEQMQVLSARARDGKLRLDDISGGCISVSSLGGIGGTAFTPLVNPPEVAILGVARAAMRPEWTGTEFAPRLMLPLCLSYDHRVIDGAEAARFTAHLVQSLGDVRRLLL